MSRQRRYFTGVTLMVLLACEKDAKKDDDASFLITEQPATAIFFDEQMTGLAGTVEPSSPTLQTRE